jgi:hypothetical protein
MKDAAHRFLPRFSLLTTLLLFALATCGLTIWQLWREVKPLRDEVQQWRNQAGVLTIDDETKMHAIFRNPYQDKTWRWRVYLPDNSQYGLFYSANKVLPGGIADKPHQGIILGAGGYPTGKGEYEITIAIRENEPDEYHATLQIKDIDVPSKTGGGPNSSLVRLGLDRNGAAWPEGKEGTRNTEGDELETRQESSGRLVLLRHRVYRDKRPSARSSEPTEGLIVWLERRETADSD